MENDADRNDSCMLSAFTGVIRMSVAKRKALTAIEGEDTFMFADWS